MIYNNQPYVHAVSLKIVDHILAEYYGLLEYRGILLDYWIFEDYYWIIGIFWNIMDYCPICTLKP
jgi:hypothetical protein